LRALSVPTYALAIVSVGFTSRVAINASPLLLPLMFQIGFGMSPTQAGLMVLVYMVGNLVMKSATTSVLRRFGFRRVLLVNGSLCVVTFIACGLLVPELPTVLIYGVLLIAGMSRSMNFTTVNTLAFADVNAEQRAGASALATMFQQVGDNPRRSLRGIRAGRFANTARGALARTGRFSQRLVRRRRTDGTGQRRRLAARSHGGRGDLGQAALISLMPFSNRLPRLPCVRPACAESLDDARSKIREHR